VETNRRPASPLNAGRQFCERLVRSTIPVGGGRSPLALGVVERPFMIRPQYHFRDSPKGLLAWDVRRLVKLSEHLPVRHIRVSEIAEVDENHWYSYGNVAPTAGVSWNTVP
jgi:hypothetical protein